MNNGLYHHVTIEFIGEEEYKIVFLMKLQNEKVADSSFIYGHYWGPEALYPFILNRENELDYGSGFDVKERYGKCNIRDKDIKIGELCTVTTYEDTKSACEEVARIIKVDRAE